MPSGLMVRMDGAHSADLVGLPTLVGAFSPKVGGVVSAGGVGFDISCGVRTHLTGLSHPRIEERQTDLANARPRTPDWHGVPERNG